MDYPKSVPNVGLVDGHFVDEDPMSGSVGSLIPSRWGNAVTDEILAVITGAGLTPDEENNGQLKAALDTRESAATATQPEAEAGTDNTKRMTPLRVFQAIAKVVKQATETAFGWAKVATQAQVDAGTDDTAFVTAKKMRFGFNVVFGENGFIAFPSWLGGLVIQWGTLAGNPGQRTITYPVTFPVEVFHVFMTPQASQTSTGTFNDNWINSLGKTTAVVYMTTNATLHWYAIGR